LVIPQARIFQIWQALNRLRKSYVGISGSRSNSGCWYTAIKAKTARAEQSSTTVASYTEGRREFTRPSQNQELAAASLIN